MNYTRSQIKREGDYRKLQGMAKELEKETGVDITRSLKKAALKKEMLKVYDNHFKEDAPPEPVKPEVKAEVEEAKAPEPKEPTPEPEKEEEPEVKGYIPEKDENPALYVAKNSYKDTESQWSFEPGQDPKPLPTDLTQGLKNALKNGKVLRHTE